jgi:hypothetical protein
MCQKSSSQKILTLDWGHCKRHEKNSKDSKKFSLGRIQDLGRVLKTKEEFDGFGKSLKVFERKQPLDYF